MVSRIVFLLVLLCSITILSAQVSVDSKDVQIARKKLQIGTDTAKYLTSIVTALNNTATQKQSPTAKAVYDYINGQAFLSTVNKTARLSGNGTSGSPLDIAQQGATTGKVMKWNGSTWSPGIDSIPIVYNLSTVSALPSGPQPSGSLAIKTYDINGNKILYAWNGIDWIYAGTFVGVKNVDSLALAPGQVKAIHLGRNGAANGQVMKWNGSAWVAGNVEGTDGNGIYSGSGNVPFGTIAKSQYFSFGWDTLSKSLEFIDSSKTIKINGVKTTVQSVSNLQAEIIYNTGTYEGYPAQEYYHNYLVYSYKIIDGVQIFSQNPDSLTADIVDNASYDIGVDDPYYKIRLTWDSVPGVDGYRVLVRDLGYSGWNFNAGVDVDTNYVLDSPYIWSDEYILTTPNYLYNNRNIFEGQTNISGSASVSGNVSAGSASVSGNVSAGSASVSGNVSAGSASVSGNVSAVSASVSGNVSAGSASVSGNVSANTFNNIKFRDLIAANNLYIGNSGAGTTVGANSFVVGDQAGNAITSGGGNNFIVGQNSGYNTPFIDASTLISARAGEACTSINSCTFIGQSAGRNSGTIIGANFIGTLAGYNSTGANNSFFFGSNTGSGSTNSYSSFFMGASAGKDASDSYQSVMIGGQSGVSAVNANSSVFIGTLTGYQASGSANSAVFIGNGCGVNDAVSNNSPGYYSVLIGRDCGTGGFSNSIALGGAVLNTAARQLNIGNVIYATGLYQNTTKSGSPITGGRFGVLTSSPNSTLASAGSFSTAITTLSANTTLGETHFTVLVDASSASRTITLPSASGINGRIYVIKKINSANTVNIATTSSQTIDGSSTITISTQYQTVRVQSDGTNWFVI